MSRVARSLGFTLVELLVTIVVMVILVTLAAPSFNDFAQRSALRGAADGVVGLVGNARQEAIKRDALVRVTYHVAAGAFCIGAAPVASITAAGCDCATAPAGCAAGSFPESGNEFRHISVKGTPAFDFVIDPRTGMLSDLNAKPVIVVNTPLGYEARVNVNAMGRAQTCSNGSKPIAGMASC